MIRCFVLCFVLLYIIFFGLGALRPLLRYFKFIILSWSILHFCQKLSPTVYWYIDTDIPSRVQEADSEIVASMCLRNNGAQRSFRRTVLLSYTCTTLQLGFAGFLFSQYRYDLGPRHRPNLAEGFGKSSMYCLTRNVAKTTTRTASTSPLPVQYRSNFYRS